MADPQERLKTYRAKRDFAVTAEPSGDATAAPDASAPARRYVVQRHRASRLHYDFRLEVDGVLASWAVPQGPTLDPKARRLAVHVEDHPIEYFDFEGVIPKGSYGGGDVIVWDWGTWQPSRPADADAAAAIDQGELHFDLQGEKLAGRFVLVRTDLDKDKGGTKGSGKEQWLLLHKKDEHAQPGWNPEEHPRSVKTGRTNDEVLAAPDVEWHSDRPAAEAAVQLGSGPPPTWDPPTAEELAALDALGKAGTWALQGQELKLTNLDKVLFPGREGEAPVTKRELIRYHAQVAPFMLPYLYDRPINLNRFPDGADKPGFWHKEVPSHAPEWLTRWRRDDVVPGETALYFVVDSVPALAWMANYGGLELHAWTSRLPDVHQPTWALIDIDPGPKVTFDDVVVLARLYRTALEHLGVAGMPKVTGKRGIQIWVPIADGYSFADTRKWVEKVSRAVGATVPELVSWEWETNRRHGLARLDYTQNAINKTLVAPFSARPAAGAPVSVPIEWDELDDPDLRPDRWTIRTVLDRLAAVGDPLHPLIGRQQRLPEF
ncbi:MAG: bifunctional non-ous end joining protein LigD [Actinomycetota bacterium]|jgi:bifunctional non-homologous end joining protein LigD|nr:bifunctional non-ous end joining protein LigD [Actinomycetota bacterium]